MYLRSVSSRMYHIIHTCHLTFLLSSSFSDCTSLILLLYIFKCHIESASTFTSSSSISLNRSYHSHVSSIFFFFIVFLILSLYVLKMRHWISELTRVLYLYLLVHSGVSSRLYISLKSESNTSSNMLLDQRVEPCLETRRWINELKRSRYWNSTAWPVRFSLWLSFSSARESESSVPLMQRAQPSNNAGTFTLGRGTHVQNLASDLEAGQLVSILTCPLDIPPHGSRAKRNCQLDYSKSVGRGPNPWKKCDCNYRWQIGHCSLLSFVRAFERSRGKVLYEYGKVVESNDLYQLI